MSALRWFRKYEKLMLGVFGVFLMFVFTFSMGVPSLDPSSWFQGGRSSRATAEDPVVAEWTDGDLLESDFNQLGISRNLMMQFTQIALSEARQRGAQPRVATVPMSNADGSLLELAVLSKKAEEMGMKINDQGVLNYLTQLTDGKLAPHEFSNIWGNMVSERVSDKQLLNMMRRELMAIRVRGMMQSGNFPVSPVRYWDYYNRMERMVSAEVMPIEVSQFVSQVSEPSQSELSDFFEKYKNQYSSPQSPEPGFRQRRKAAFGYIKLDFEKFFEVELAAVTDEQVKEYYEKNKDDFQQMSFLEDDLESGLDAPDASTGAPGNPENDGTGSADSSEATTDDTTDGDDAAVPPAGADGTPTGPEATEAGSEVIEEVIKPESTPSPQPQDEATEGAAEAVKNVVEETAAIVQDGLESAAEEAVEAVKEGTTEAADAVAAEVTKQVETDGKSADEASAEEAKPEMKKEELDTSDLEVETKPVTYKSIESVTDEIKRTLARPAAQQKFDKALSAARLALDRYYRAHVMLKIQQSKGVEAETPEVPDVSSISVNPKLEVLHVPLSDESEITETELGQAFDIQFTGGGVQQIMFADVAYAQAIQPYRPEEFPKGEVTTTKFLFWRTDFQEAFVPKFEDVKEQVVEAWKLQQAADLALAAAKSDAEKANADKAKSLADAISTPNRTFFNTGEISWVTGGNIPMDQSSRPQITEIDGMDSPGDDLYESLFSLNVGETGYALNGPKTVAYVMKVTEQSPELEIRREGFFENVDKITGVPFLARVESRRDLGLTYKDILDSSKVEWKREPRAGGQ